MFYHRVCNYINTTGATSGAGTAYPSRAPEFIPVFSGVCVARSLVLCACFVDRCLSVMFLGWCLGQPPSPRWLSANASSVVRGLSVDGRALMSSLTSRWWEFADISAAFPLMDLRWCLYGLRWYLRCVPTERSPLIHSRPFRRWPCADVFAAFPLMWVRWYRGRSAGRWPGYQRRAIAAGWPLLFSCTNTISSTIGETFSTFHLVTLF